MRSKEKGEKKLVPKLTGCRSAGTDRLSQRPIIYRGGNWGGEVSLQKLSIDENRLALVVEREVARTGGATTAHSLDCLK